MDDDKVLKLLIDDINHKAKYHGTCAENDISADLQHLVRVVRALAVSSPWVISKNILILISLVMLSSISFASVHGAGMHLRHYPATPLSAKEAREITMETTYEKHQVAIDWWVDFINDKIREQSEKDNSSSVCVDITVVNVYVVGYLAEVYEAAGYKTEMLPEWDKIKNIPDGKTYLSLSW